MGHRANGIRALSCPTTSGSAAAGGVGAQSGAPGRQRRRVPPVPVWNRGAGRGMIAAASGRGAGAATPEEAAMRLHPLFRVRLLPALLAAGLAAPLATPPAFANSYKRGHTSCTDFQKA